VATENIRETPKPPESPFGKLPDFANPALTKEQRDALYRKATYIAPPSTENTIDTSTIDKRTLRMLGQQYRMGGPQSVPRVTGRDSAKWMAAIVKEAANPTPLSPGEAPMPPIMASAADYQANLASYKETSKRYHNISAFEYTALANSEKVVIPLLDKIPDTGNQIGNQVMRTGASIFGHGQVPAFQAARQSVLAEFSRLLQTANASGIITDTARKELEAGIGPNFTKQQMINALDTLRAEAHNRRVATANELTDIRNLIGFDPASGLPNPNDNLANPANPQSATTAAPDVVWKLVNGKLVKE
jgi:hypothetical protein